MLAGLAGCNGCSTPSCYCKTAPTGDHPNPFDSTCSTFLKCIYGSASITPCPSGTVYDPDLGVCNWANAVTCRPGCTSSPPQTKPPPETPDESSEDTAPYDSSSNDFPSTHPTPQPTPQPPSPVEDDPDTSNSNGGPAPANALLPNGPLFVGYYQSWSAPWKSNGADLDLAKIPAYVNVVIVSFVRPDCNYAKGSLKLAGTGLDFSADGSVVRDAIAALKSRNKNTRVLLAVGGATYTNFGGLNAQCVKDIVTDFGFDGADLDWEPSAPRCTASGGRVSCPTDSEGVSAVTKLRAALPKGKYILSTASFHVGCYGEAEFAGSKPSSGYTGINLAMARSPAGQSLDLVNIMSYDAGNLGSTGFDPKESFKAHRRAWPKAALALGVEVPPEAWGGNTVSLAQVGDYATFSRANGGAGLMMWSLNKKGTPGANDIAARACSTLGMKGCSTPLPTV